MSRPPRVIVNDRMLLRPLTGVGHYVQELLRALAEVAPPGAVRPFVTETLRLRRTARMRAPHSEVGVSARPDHGGPGHPPHHGGGRRWLSWARPWLDRIYGVAFRLAARRADLYHEPNHIPLRCDRPTVTTVHDLSVLLHPEWHPPDRARWYERAFAAGVRQTTRFIAASEFTRREMVRHLGVPAERIDVTYQAPRPAFRQPTQDAVRATLAAYELPPAFFLFVGTLEPRKNVSGLLEAYTALPAALRAAHPLVLAGGWGWRTEALAAQLASAPCRSDVRLIGYADDAALAALYASCTALVWPTWYEGFGLPPLEALACGAPVVVSNVASLPEVVGDAGVLLDPQDTAAWTATMRRLADDEGWRQGWRARGPARAAEFSWRRCATQTLACYDAALAAAGA